MKKNIKMMVTAMVLALTIVFQTATPALARAWDVNNNWEFRFGHSNCSIYVGQQDSLYAYNGLWGNAVTYKSSNPSVAAVVFNGDEGHIIGKKAGKVTITATDGVHTAKTVLTVKPISKAKKSEVVFNYAHFSELISGETYTLKTLAGSQIKKITSKKATVKGTTFTMPAGGGCTLKVTLKDGQKFSLDFGGTKELPTSTHERAKAIIKADMPKYGITMNSSDLEKAMFAYNWVAGNIVRGEGYIDHKSCRYCSNWGKDCGIINHVGDCDVQAEAVLTICEVVGLWAVPVCNNAAGGGHAYCGVRVDGEWYLMDTTGSEPWDFSFVVGSIFLRSKDSLCAQDSAMRFKPAKNACKDIVFTSTKYDKPLSQYKEQYDAWKATQESPFDDYLW